MLRGSRLSAGWALKAFNFLHVGWVFANEDTSVLIKIEPRGELPGIRGFSFTFRGLGRRKTQKNEAMQLLGCSTRLPLLFNQVLSILQQLIESYNGTIKKGPVREGPQEDDMSHNNII
jgi:hypothetical protein